MAGDISCQQAVQIMQGGNAVLVDVRTPAEFSEVRANGAVNLPLDQLTKESLSSIAKGKQILFICRSGKRSEQALAQAVSWGFSGENVAGGTMAWESAGCGVARGEATVISLERQVRIAAGGLVAIGTALGLLGATWALAVPLVVGCGLVFSGVTDSCGLAMVIAKMPWNRRGGAACAR